MEGRDAHQAFTNGISPSWFEFLGVVIGSLLLFSVNIGNTKPPQMAGDLNEVTSGLRPSCRHFSLRIFRSFPQSGKSMG